MASTRDKDIAATTRAMVDYHPGSPRNTIFNGDCIDMLQAFMEAPANMTSR